MKDELIQYYIVNSELDMSPGKIAAQVAHVAVMVAMTENGDDFVCKHNLFDEWYQDYNQKKIVLKGKQKDIERLVADGFYYIRDLGFTEIPEGSLTCASSGTMWKSRTSKYVKRLQLLK